MPIQAIKPKNAVVATATLEAHDQASELRSIQHKYELAILDLRCRHVTEEDKLRRSYLDEMAAFHGGEG